MCDRICINLRGVVPLLNIRPASLALVKYRIVLQGWIQTEFFESGNFRKFADLIVPYYLLPKYT